MTADPAWMTEALCRGLATSREDPWHPAEDGEWGNGPTVMYATARRICAQCPVRLECAHEGLALLSRVSVQGMWGGLTAAELRALARAKGLPNRKVADHGTRARYISQGCRCDDCKRANSGRERERRVARDEVPARGTARPGTVTGTRAESQRPAAACTALATTRTR